MRKMQTLDELFVEEESLRAKRAKARANEERAYNNSPHVIARRKAEIDKEIRQGLRDANGDWIDLRFESDGYEDEDEDEDDNEGDDNV